MFHVEEKIHGANFQFNVDSNGITAGKRTAFIGETEGFYSYKLVVEKYSESIIKMKNEMFPNHNIIVYGELFGIKIMQNGNTQHAFAEMDFYGTISVDTTFGSQDCLL